MKQPGQVDPSQPDPPGEPRLPEVLPVLPLHEAVVFPLTMAPLEIGEERSVKLVDEAMRTNRLVAVVLQRRSLLHPGPDDLCRVATAASITQLVRGTPGPLRLVVQGLERVRLLEFVQTDPYLAARIQRAPEREGEPLETEALVRAVAERFGRLAELLPELPDGLVEAVQRVREPAQLSALVIAFAPLAATARQELLELDELPGRLRRLVELLAHEASVRELESEISSRTRSRLSAHQREHVLREQLRTIQRELGDDPEAEGQAEVDRLRRALAQARLPEEVRREVDRELSRLARMAEASLEYGMVQTYLDWVAGLPWGRHTGGAIDLGRARAVLDEDHYDLEKIKERILEHLAVHKLRAERAGPPAPPGAAPTEAGREPILCFVGPPGVGKTSLGQSVARAMGRSFVRVSLGGIHDESEIRGHRRTYVGALPGRILQGLRRAGAADPVFMLDEVDKLGAGFHGDPAAALLEVLDPAQNQAFVDTYLGLPFDLRQVLFICTANTVEPIPPALLDRMEVLNLAGYSEQEKLHIARRHLWPKLVRAHGLLEGEVRLEEETLLQVLRAYTREAGVRGLERELGGLCRKAARRIGEGQRAPIAFPPGQLHELLGPPRFLPELSERLDRPGVALGLAWTPAGGELLFVEAAMMPASEERLILTGMLGDVMRESAQAALTYLRSNAVHLGVDPRLFEGQAVHVHVPAGAVPKDGPSAGVTILVALASLVTGRRPAPELALTGELTLRGKILPVGGIKEKVLAGYRAGVRTVILPRRSEDALAEVPAEVRSAMRFVLVQTADEVLAHALPPGQPVAQEHPAPPVLH